MRSLVITALLLVAVMPAPAAGQARPDFSGTLTLVPDAASGASPASPPGFGPQLTIRHDGNNFTVTRIMGGNTINVKHVLDGSEIRSRSTGALCVGDAQLVWTASWQQDSIDTTLVGSIAAGTSAVVKRNVKSVFRLPSADTLNIDVTAPASRGGDPGIITAHYRRTG